MSVLALGRGAKSREQESRAREKRGGVKTGCGMLSIPLTLIQLDKLVCRYITAMLFVFLWLVYVLLSSLKATGSL